MYRQNLRLRRQAKLETNGELQCCVGGLAGKKLGKMKGRYEDQYANVNGANFGMILIVHDSEMRSWFCEIC